VATSLTKRFGDVRAVDDLGFVVEPGTVTGFLGPNGAGKTTTLRMILGLVRPDAGTATISGLPYAELARPNDEVGALLDATGFHPARSGRDHLRVQCTVNGYPDQRADETLEIVGLTTAARRPVRGYSLGMRQRLALASALLGDPAVLALDEPANGLDPEGMAWLRRLLRDLAARGRTVLVSSHVLFELEQLVDHVVVIADGRLIRQGPLTELSGHGGVVDVRTPQGDELVATLSRTANVRAERTGRDAVRISGMPAADVGHLAFAARIELHELTPARSDLEQVFLSLTNGAPEAAAAAHTTGQARSEPLPTEGR
jgi:ABC-2 type transport system ATP-binding protein